jgi:hypothetical protein
LNSDVALKIVPVSLDFAISSIQPKRILPLSNSSNTNILSYVNLRNYASFNWKVKNQTNESESLYCYLYGSSSGATGATNVGTAELIQRVEPNETMNINVPVRSHFYRFEYTTKEVSNCNVSCDVLTVPNQTFANDQAVYKPFQQYDIANLSRQAARWDSDVIRGNFLGTSLNTRNVLINEVSNTTAQIGWNTTANYNRLGNEEPMLIQSTSALDDDLTIFIEGLDLNGNLVEESVVLTDAITGATTNSSFLKVNRAIVSSGTPGVQYFNSGDITVAGHTTGAVQEFIVAGASQSQSLKYAVPNNKAVVLRDITIKGDIDTTFEMRLFKWNSLDVNTIRYEELAVAGSSLTTDFQTFPVNLFLQPETEFAVVVVADALTTNDLTMSTVWEQYDSSASIEAPI